MEFKRLTFQSIGNKKEKIIKSRIYIYPAEMEEVFYTHPDVLEMAIIGLPDTVLGEISCACIKLKDDSKINTNQLRSFIEKRVANYKVPDRLLIVEEFPMTASGKIKKMALQDQLKEDLKLELR